MDYAITVVAEPAQEGRQHGSGLRLGIVQQDDALARSLQPLGEQFNCCAGGIGFQSLAQRSAPNTAMPRFCRASSVAGVISKNGKRKNGVLGVVVAVP